MFWSRNRHRAIACHDLQGSQLTAEAGAERFIRATIEPAGVTERRRPLEGPIPAEELSYYRDMQGRIRLLI